MAILSSTNIDAVHAEIMKQFSNFRMDIPIIKAQLRSGIIIIDNKLDTAEIAVATAIPAGSTRDWIIANPEVVREMMEITEKKRREVL